jgi:hypothetical protein
MTKKNHKHLEIALHNEQTSKYLYNDAKKQFNDWVITTAFYSAMHFLYYYSLPVKSLTNSKKPLLTFDNLFSEYRIGNESKHQFTKRWINRNCDHFISAYYNALYDDCKNARYKGYNYEMNEAKIALKRLREIKKYCI